jgi:toxic protein SymE
MIILRHKCSILKIIHMQTKTIRQVKIYSRYRTSGKRGLGQNKEVPWLNVSGLWLQQAGFNIGDRLKITVENNRLTIINQQTDGDQSH